MWATGFLLMESGLIYLRREFNMIKFLKSLFKSDPGKKLLKERDRLYKQAVELQRNGQLRPYAEIMSQIEQIEEEYSRLSPNEE